MYIEEKQLESFVLDAGLVSKTDFGKIKKEAEEKKISIGTILVNEGKINSDELGRIQAYILGIPYVNLSEQKINFDVLSLIPESVARAHNIIAFKKNLDSLEVAMLDTDDLVSIEFIKKKVGLKIFPRLTDLESIKLALLQYQKSLKAEFGDIIQKEASTLLALKVVGEKGGVESEVDLKKMAEDLPIIRIVDTLLKHAIIQNASDVHIEPMENEVLIRYRIDGILHDAMILPKTAAAGITARIKVLSDLKLDEKRLPQDGRFKIEIDDKKVSIRVSILPTFFGEKAVMRLLREGAAGFSLEKLGFHGEGLEKLHWAMKQKTGVFITSGPTGSGKTSTLYTLLDLVNSPGLNISTIEDPIEYQMPRINQTQVKPDIGYSFANGLRALLRQDPDIIMVGEIRDNETASLAINAALTGHLVLTTLHTNSAAGAIPRLLDLKTEPFLLISTINVVIGQRLVRKLSDQKEKYFLSKARLDSLRQIVDLDRVLNALKDEKIINKNDTWEKILFYKPKITVECPDGYSGRVCISEVLKMSVAIRELVMRRSSTKEIETQAKKEGMLTMIEDGIFKAVSGVTSVEEILRVVSE